MRIAWFTPLSRKTGVSKYSLLALQALSESYELDVWTVRTEDDYDLEGRFSVHEIGTDPDTVEKLDDYDLVVYNMGNNSDFHVQIYEVYKRKKGVVIIHDKIMHHILAYLCLIRAERPELYFSYLDHYYGKDGVAAARGSFAKGPPLWDTDEVVDYPFLELCFWNATGIIVHSKENLEFARAKSVAPSELIYFPFYSREDLPAPSGKNLDLPDGRTVVLQYGYIAPNKNPHLMLEAMALDPVLKDSLYFVIAGRCEESYEARLRGLIEKNGLQGSVRITGYIDDDELFDYISRSDICLNLRFPSTEGASWTLLEQMFFSKAIIATATGFYNEMPDDIILKVGTPIDIEELRGAVKRLIDDKDLLATLSSNAREFAMNNFSKKKYAERFKSFLGRVNWFRDVLGFVDRVSDEASSFLFPGDHAGPFLDRVCKEMDFLGIKGRPYGQKMNHDEAFRKR